MSNKKKVDKPVDTKYPCEKVIELTVYAYVVYMLLSEECLGVRMP